jgi:membrane-bound inhibitor of C-type lysozyme
MMKKWITIGCVIVLALIAISLYSSGKHASRKLITTAVYSCDNDKAITASYFDGDPAPEVGPGEMPRPTGSVDVRIGDEATATLKQTISADGARYATADESLVFWNKGNEALIMRNNSMDLDYRNCKSI